MIFSLTAVALFAVMVALIFWRAGDFAELAALPGFAITPVALFGIVYDIRGARTAKRRRRDAIIGLTLSLLLATMIALCVFVIIVGRLE